MGGVKQGVVPPNGWHYPVGPEPNALVFHGESFEDVVRQITKYRAGNSIELGNPARDLEDYICRNWPHFCGGSSATIDTANHVPVTPRDAPKSYLQRVIDWIAVRYTNAGSFALVSATEAERRAAICVKCPQNQEWQNGCPPCIAKAEHDLFLIRQGRTTLRSRYLKGCRVAGHDNEASCWMPEKLLQHREGLNLPSICWMRALTPDEA